MTLGERLLNLSAEYAHSKDVRSDAWGENANPAGREPVEIAAEYEAVLRELLVTSVAT